MASRVKVIELRLEGAFLGQADAVCGQRAAVMQHLDLVITSDTAIAHLAGALGARVWLALAKSADWRWLLDREESPWYPTMRLFRQREWGWWKEIFPQISAEILASRI